MTTSCIILLVLALEINIFATALKMNSKDEPSKAMEELVLEKIHLAKTTSKKLTIQATCQSYSGVDNDEPDSEPLSLLNFADFSIDAKNLEVTVQPGVRFIDMVQSMKKSGVSFPAHGAYGGQTVIGAMSTGSHGNGLPAIHNFVKRLKVVNGKGEVKTVQPEDPEFGAWAISVGGLGIILEATFELVPEFKLFKHTVNETRENALKQIVTNPEHLMSEISFRIESAHALVLTCAVTQEPATKNECCYDNDVGSSHVISYVDDLAWPSGLDTDVATDGVCRKHGARKVWVTPGWKVGVAFLGSTNELNVKVSHLQKAIDIAGTLPWPKDTSFMIRRILKDKNPSFWLSPYFDEDRMSIDVVGSSVETVWGWNTANPQPSDETTQFFKIFAQYREALNAADIDIRYHVGKNGDTPFWDKARLNTFMTYKAANDPSNILTNEFLKRMSV